MWLALKNGYNSKTATKTAMLKVNWFKPQMLAVISVEAIETMSFLNLLIGNIPSQVNSKLA